MVKRAAPWSELDLMMSWGGWRLYNMFQSKPHRVHALRPQVISGPSRQFSLRHLEKKKQCMPGPHFQNNSKFRSYNQMHTWLRLMATFINRHCNSNLLFRGKCTLNLGENVRWVLKCAFLCYLFNNLFHNCFIFREKSKGNVVYCENCKQSRKSCVLYHFARSRNAAIVLANQLKLVLASQLAGL